ncbi:MAG: hypothetical protein ABJH75_10460, partial [Roseibium sp.]
MSDTALSFFLGLRHAPLVVQIAFFAAFGVLAGAALILGMWAVYRGRRVAAAGLMAMGVSIYIGGFFAVEAWSET